MCCTKKETKSGNANVVHVKHWDKLVCSGLTMGPQRIVHRDQIVRKRGNARVILARHWDKGGCRGLTMGPQRSQFLRAALCWSQFLKGNTTSTRLAPILTRSRLMVSQTGSSSVLRGSSASGPEEKSPCESVGEIGAWEYVIVGTAGTSCSMNTKMECISVGLVIKVGTQVARRGLIRRAPALGMTGLIRLG